MNLKLALIDWTLVGEEEHALASRLSLSTFGSDGSDHFVIIVAIVERGVLLTD